MTTTSYAPKGRATVTPDEFAQITGFHYQTVLRWCRIGDLATIPRSAARQRWMIRATEIDRCLEEGFPTTAGRRVA